MRVCLGPGRGGPVPGGGRRSAAVQRGWRLVPCVLLLLATNALAGISDDNSTNVMQDHEAGMPDMSASVGGSHHEVLGTHGPSPALSAQNVSFPGLQVSDCVLALNNPIPHQY